MDSGRYFKMFLSFILLLFILASCSYFKAIKKPEVKPAERIALPEIFTDNMVLQQKKRCNIWGTAAPGGLVTVQFANQTKKAIVKENGKWLVELSPKKAGGPFELVVFGLDTLRFKNILVGEVWVCSGQSNMEWTVSKAANAIEEIQQANYPAIRLFTVKRTVSPVPLDTIPAAGWQVCTQQTIPDFSAVAYYFGRQLHKKLNVPIGLIHTSWGGTPAEAWTSQKTLKTLPDFVQKIQAMEANLDSLKEIYSSDQSSFELLLKKWQDKLVALEKGTLSNQLAWYEPQLDISSWGEMEVPRKWEQQGLEGYDGMVWFQKKIVIPSSWQGADLALYFGPIDDADVTWFNGIEVGQTSSYNLARIYTIPASAVKAGENTIAVRVFDHGGDGGFWGEKIQYHLDCPAGESIDLSGEWRYQPSLDLAKLPSSYQRPIRPSNTPSFLYNAMIHPLIPFAFQGVIWYQGEGNAGRAYQYRELFPAMITDWRQNWGQGDFPFLFVQLANFMPIKPEPADDAWAELREAQLWTLSLPNTGMAVIIDIGDAEDIHPKNKQEVGRRLALNAQRLVYKEKIPYSGPIYKNMKIEDRKIRLYFDHVYQGLKAKGEKLTGFAIAGIDSNFYWADATIEGKTVVVSSTHVPKPIAVRYGWASNPVCNLYNSADLPASPFRTDEWPGMTFGKK